MRIEERLPVRVGLGVLEKEMSVQEARKWGKLNMPADLRAAGFEVCVFVADPVINGEKFIRVTFGK